MCRLQSMKLIFSILYLLGLLFILHSPLFHQDPMQQMSQLTQSPLYNLIQTKYFRIIRLNINSECQLGIMNKICKSKSCTVCRCNEQDIPELWTSTDKAVSHLQGQDMWSLERQAKNGWVWHVEDEANDLGEYFDIHTNIQSFTNYNGSYTWSLIYGQNCFQSKENQYISMCAEEKTLYNIISGLHTSISTHLSRFYKNTTQSHWNSLKVQQQNFHFNHSEYNRRVLSHPERIKHMFFLYRILAKAIKESAHYLRTNHTIISDNFTEDLTARTSLEDLLRHIEQFDFSSKEKEDLKFFKKDNPRVKQYQKYIHNISSILDCVECQKCRLFGKMQTYGIGTALKILLGYPSPYKRNEIVALFNVFNKISMSIDTYYRNRHQVIQLGYECLNEDYVRYYLQLGALLAVLLMIRGDQKLNKLNAGGDKEERQKRQ